MNIAIDYDGTFTSDPVLWAKFCCQAYDAGHTPMIVTWRYPTEAITDAVFCRDVFYTSRQAKAKFMQDAGVQIDIWIDDNPSSILRSEQG